MPGIILNRKFAAGLSLVAASIFASNPVYSQNYSSSGANWSGSWGFQSTSEKSLAIQRAQAIWNVEKYQEPAAAQTTINNHYKNSYDNRSSYQEFITGSGALGDVDINFNGDEIGQNTNAIGAMNTGETNIEIDGSGNSITAMNQADSSGCIDGGITLSETGLSNIETPGDILPSINLPSSSTDCR